MQIRVSSGDCRTAIAAALTAIEAKVAEDRGNLKKECIEQLKEGATRTQQIGIPGVMAEIEAAAERDVEHMMQRHPALADVELLKNLTKMIEYHHGPDIVIDDTDFALIGEHLTKVDPITGVGAEEAA